MDNKVKFNLKNVHWSKITEGTGGAITYGTPKAWPGAVSLSLDAEGDTNTFYADGIAYYVTVANNGYSGDFESALIPDDFRTEVLKETFDETQKVYYENASVNPAAFALLFEFDGDQSEIKHILYNCKATRPQIASQTNEAAKEVRTESLSLTASPRADGIVKARCSDKTAPNYETWYNTVTEP